MLLTSAQVDITNNGILYITGSTDTVSVTGNFTNASSASLTNNGRFYAKQNYTNNQASTPVGTVPDLPPQSLFRPTFFCSLD